MLRLVLDTNVIVAGFRSPTGASAGLIQQAMERRFQFLVTPTLLLEYEAVIMRGDHLDAAGATMEDCARFLDMIVDHAQPVEVSVRYRPQLADPDDEFVLEAAINGQADALVTFEVRTFAAAAGRFGIAAVTPGQAWGIIRS